MGSSGVKMADTREQPVPLQTDTITQLPGAGVRTIIAQVMVNGVPTPVQMQVTSIADANGVILDNFAQQDLLNGIILELQGIRNVLCTAYGFPFFVFNKTGFDTADIDAA